MSTEYGKKFMICLYIIMEQLTMDSFQGAVLTVSMVLNGKMIH